LHHTDQANSPHVRAALSEDLMATKPLRIAIIGSGLGGAVLADLLAGHHDVQ